MMESEDATVFFDYMKKVIKELETIGKYLKIFIEKDFLALKWFKFLRKR